VGIAGLLRPVELWIARRDARAFTCGGSPGRGARRRAIRIYTYPCREFQQLNKGGKMRRRLTYANVVATLALVFSMSGGALAANHYLISSTKQISPKVLKKLKGNRGPTGLTGPQGKEGTPGKNGDEGKEGKAATIPGVKWQPITLENGWEEYGGYGAPSFTIDDQGFVHLSGALYGKDSTSSRIGVLPAGFRPTLAEAVWLRAAATNGLDGPELVDIEIGSNGEITAYPASGDEAFVSLEGVSFYAG
jgi:hypothetical protein